MAHLRPCPACLRHVRVDAERCPFCEGALALDPSPPVMPGARLGRAARMAFGAAIAVGLAGCDEKKPPNDPTNAQMDAGGGAPAEDAATPPPPPPPDINQAKPYGAPPADGLLV
ncbi:MAG: hypothetical protein ACXVEF_16910 [Polyangiales bacterium]